MLQERRSPRTEPIRFPRWTVGLVAHRLAPPPWSARLFPTTAPPAAGWPVARPRLHLASGRAVESAPAVTAPAPPRGWLPSKPLRCGSPLDVLGGSRRIPPPQSPTSQSPPRHGGDQRLPATCGSLAGTGTAARNHRCCGRHRPPVGPRYRGSETRPDGVGIQNQHNSRSRTRPPWTCAPRAAPGTDASAAVEKTSVAAVDPGSRSLSFLLKPVAAHKLSCQFAHRRLHTADTLQP